MSDAANGLKQGMTFYNTFIVSNSDDTVDLTGEAISPSCDLNELIASTTEAVDGHGMISYIYECTPIYKVVRGNTRIIRLKKKP